MAKQSIWHLSTLGGLRVESESKGLDKFRTQKTAALLALLTLHGPQNREKVCALLWPDAAPEAARNSLSAALSTLRRDLGDEVFVADRQNVSLAPNAITTDLGDFNLALKNQDFARAVEIYRGHLLPNFHEDPFPMLAGEAEEKARGAFVARLGELETRGQHLETLELARRAAKLFGDDERWFLAMMRAHYGLSDWDAALRVFKTLGRFSSKNGEATSEDARLLAKTIRRHKEANNLPLSSTHLLRNGELRSIEKPNVPYKPDTTVLESPEFVFQPPRHQLPTLWTRFFGREAERDLLCQWLIGDKKLITLSGAGGSGKTRLALETLHDLLPNWKGDLFFVPLAALFDAELLYSTIQDALQLTRTPDFTPLEHLEQALRDRHVLLFLDNFEQLVDGGAQLLQKLRERLPNVTFLVTSRVLLQLPGEREFLVSPLPTPLQNTSLREVQEYASTALFCDRADIVISAENAEAIGALCRRLDGIPLALELAAARAKVMSPRQILERLQKHPDFLQSRELGLPVRHKTLRATIEWSTELLSPELRAFWIRLSIFHGSWSLEAAETIAAPGICEEYETLDWLAQLRECSLIWVEERDGQEGRFRMLQTLREFGREQLEGAETIELSFFDFFLELARQAATAMQGAGKNLWLARLDAEQDNLRAALNWARQNDAMRGLQLATALIDFWEARLSLNEGRTWIETFLSATEHTSTPADSILKAADLIVRARALSGAGRLASHSIVLKEGRALVAQGVQDARQGGDTRSFVYAVSAFVTFAVTSGDVQSDLMQAHSFAAEALELAKQSGDKSVLLEALNTWNLARLSIHDFEGLRDAQKSAIALARELADENRLAVALHALALLAYVERDWEEANHCLDESTPLARRLSSPWELLAALWHRSNVARESGDLKLARQAISEMWEICRDNPALLWARALLMVVVGFLRVREGELLSAALVLGSEQWLREESGYQLPPVLRLEYENYYAELRNTLGEDIFEDTWRMGRATLPQQAVDAALFEMDNRQYPRQEH